MPTAHLANSPRRSLLSLSHYPSLMPKMDSPNQQASSNGFSPTSDLAAEYDTSDLETAWSFAERGGLFDLDDADGAK